jgi:hypothetical protein
VQESDDKDEEDIPSLTACTAKFSDGQRESPMHTAMLWMIFPEAAFIAK